MKVLVSHVKRSLLPDRVLNAPEIDQLTVITEPGHRQQYGPDVDVRLVDSALDVGAVCRTALQVLREREVDRILSPFELGMPVAGYLRSYFGLPGMGFETTNAFTNKYVMKQRLAAAGIPVATFRLALGLHRVPAAAAELGWPVIVKPAFGGGALNVCVFAGPGEFEAFVASPESEPVKALAVPLIVEQFATVEEEYHCDGVVLDGTVAFAALSRYLMPLIARREIFGSHLLPPSFPDRAELLDLHARAVAALGLDAGVTHMEVLRTTRGLLVGEIACRPAGMGVVDAVRLQTGVDIWDAFVRTSLGLPPVIDVAERSDLVAHVRLPVTPGRIVRLSTADELAALPGVVKVDMELRAGDIVPPQPRFGSANGSGFVYFTVDRQADLADAVRRIHDGYRFETEDVMEDVPAR
jgi:hypothetical protein